MTLKSLLGQLRFKAKNFYFGLVARRSEIDYSRLDQEIKTHNLAPVLKMIDENVECGISSFDQSENRGYFRQYKKYDNRDTLPRNPFPLFPPNVAVVDFLLKNSLQSSTIIDYGCGFNNLAVILRYLGFGEAYGEDNFSQIKKETIKSFLKNFNLENSLKSKDEALLAPTNVALCICYYWSWLDREIIDKELNNPNLKYLILDVRYSPPLFVRGFRIKTIYDKLIVIYERKSS